MAPPGDKLYGGSDRITNMGLFVTVSGEDPGPWVPATGSAAPCRTARW